MLLRLGTTQIHRKVILSTGFRRNTKILYILEKCLYNKEIFNFSSIYPLSKYNKYISHNILTMILRSFIHSIPLLIHLIHSGIKTKIRNILTTYHKMYILLLPYYKMYILLSICIHIIPVCIFAYIKLCH